VTIQSQRGLENSLLTILPKLILRNFHVHLHKEVRCSGFEPDLECMFGSKTLSESAILHGTELDVGTLGMNHEESVLFSFKTHISFVC
jgi:hypothetical protein